MAQRRWSTQILLRYVLIQLPGTVLLVLALLMVQRWGYIPGWLFWLILALWAAKDVILYPFAWRAYDPEAGKERNPLLGNRGIAMERLAPSGYVRVGGELWRAEVMENGRAIETGESVRVDGMRGSTLVVRPEKEI